MNKLYLIIPIMLFSMTSFAQTKGDMYISGYISAECSMQQTTLPDGSHSTSAYHPLNSSFGLGIEYGYFVINNFRLSLALSMPFSSVPTSEENGKWLKNSTIGFGINPNISYYLILADRFYYTPEAGVAFEFGSYYEKLSSSTSYKSGYWGWQVYLTLISFEFRISEILAIGASMESLRHSSTRYESDPYPAFSQFNFNLNNADIYIRFYF